MLANGMARRYVLQFSRIARSIANFLASVAVTSLWLLGPFSTQRKSSETKHCHTTPCTSLEVIAAGRMAPSRRMSSSPKFVTLFSCGRQPSRHLYPFINWTTSPCELSTGPTDPPPPTAGAAGHPQRPVPACAHRRIRGPCSNCGSERHLHRHPAPDRRWPSRYPAVRRFRRA